MRHAFPWFAVHKTTKYVIAGFAEFNDAVSFCAMFKHGQYIVASGAELSIQS